MLPCIEISNALPSLLNPIITPVLSCSIKGLDPRLDESAAKIIVGCQVEPCIKDMRGVTVTFRFPARIVVERSSVDAAGTN